MGTVGWLLVVAVGIALGFSVGRLWPGSAARLNALEEERDAAREDLETYRQEVSAHFARTAHLFDKVTADYRGLYEHLATGSRQLGALRGESVELPQAPPEARRLARTDPDPDAPPAEPSSRAFGESAAPEAGDLDPAEPADLDAPAPGDLDAPQPGDYEQPDREAAKDR
jgi:uncharacterized protein